MNALKQLLCTRNQLLGNKHHFTGQMNKVKLHSQEQEVVIALGSNVGNRVDNFNEALQLMKKAGIHIKRHACLYETAPAYVTDQAHFLNSAVRAVTKHGPHELLVALKKIGKDMGCTNGLRYGPRPIDLDILFYGQFNVCSDILTIPNERIWEHPFVMAPLMDLLGSAVDSDTVSCWHSFSGHSCGLSETWERMGGESLIGKGGLKRVLPIGNGLLDWSQKTSVMGFLNLAPDSFSDGGKLLISVKEELSRLVPVLEAFIRMPEVEGKLVSVDTYHSEVASEAVRRGAHLVNDVSAGKLDSNMFKIGSELHLRVRDAELSGIPAWRIILDPGPGFSKKTEDNLDILMGLPDIRAEIAKNSLAISHAPVLIGPSRKRFLGDICSCSAAKRSCNCCCCHRQCSGWS
ncbi:Folate synthesis bifunctional protein, mitochondrial [Quillaja saponaria]|uniref:2-amino-4-hydroxy-6-hydroxymethyldihydropteridine diphosphokinase n=1 Tax=Quillaja saponaria TaxID=32244 RepID=A0AAD7KPM2_QUISA|nr:Folate synthesis bifunctional protein, mitochondrial [Quillaja saponaria]